MLDSFFLHEQPLKLTQVLMDGGTGLKELLQEVTTMLEIYCHFLVMTLALAEGRRGGWGWKEKDVINPTIVMFVFSSFSHEVDFKLNTVSSIVDLKGRFLLHSAQCLFKIKYFCEGYELQRFFWSYRRLCQEFSVFSLDLWMIVLTVKSSKSFIWDTQFGFYSGMKVNGHSLPFILMVLFFLPVHMLCIY